MSAELRAVLFDMDGVLIDSAAVANRLLAATAARHGVHLTSPQPSWTHSHDVMGVGEAEPTPWAPTRTGRG